MIDNIVEKIKLSEKSIIRDALEAINAGKVKMAVVVDQKGKFLGTIVDGDIRRGLLNGLNLNDSIKTIIHTNAVICNVNDSREEILQKALDQNIQQIPIVDNDGILISIQIINDLIKPVKSTNKVVLMVGGLGKRLRPLTNEIPKPLLNVGNKPILETIISNFSKYGFKDFILSVNYKSEMIENYFQDGSSFGVKIEYIKEDKRMGTAGALSLIREKLVEPFFVMNGDLLTNVNFEHLLEYHTKYGAKATMCVREYDFQVPYGVVKLDDHNITAIEEKPVEKFFVNAGIYMLEPECLQSIPDNVFFDMPSLFEKLMEDNKKVISFPIREYWLDIGRIDEYEKANNEYIGVFS